MKLQVTVFCERSVALKVIVVTPTGNSDPLGRPSTWVKETELQLSIVPGGEKFITLPPAEVASSTMSPGQLMAGGVSSLTVTVCSQVAVSP